LWGWGYEKEGGREGEREEKRRRGVFGKLKVIRGGNFGVCV